MNSKLSAMQSASDPKVPGGEIERLEKLQREVKLETYRHLSEFNVTKHGIPKNLKCQLSGKLLLDPVTLQSGVTLDR